MKKTAFVVLFIGALLFSGCASTGNVTEFPQGPKTTGTYKNLFFSVAYPMEWNITSTTNNSVVFSTPLEEEGDFQENYTVLAYPVPSDFPDDNEGIKELFQKELSAYSESKYLYGNCVNQSEGRMCVFIYSFAQDGFVEKVKQVMLFREENLCQSIYVATPATYQKYLGQVDRTTSMLECF